MWSLFKLMLRSAISNGIFQDISRQNKTQKGLGFSTITTKSTQSGLQFDNEESNSLRFVSWLCVSRMHLVVQKLSES